MAMNAATPRAGGHVLYIHNIPTSRTASANGRPRLATWRAGFRVARTDAVRGPRVFTSRMSADPGTILAIMNMGMCTSVKSPQFIGEVFPRRQRSDVGISAVSKGKMVCPTHEFDTPIGNTALVLIRRSSFVPKMRDLEARNFYRY